MVVLRRLTLIQQKCRCKRDLLVGLAVLALAQRVVEHTRTLPQHALRILEGQLYNGLLAGRPVLRRAAAPGDHPLAQFIAVGLGVGAAEFHIKHAVNVGQRLGVLHGVGVLYQRRRLIAQCDHLVLPRLAHQRIAVAGADEIPHQHQRRHRAHRQRAQQPAGAEQRQQHRDGSQIVDALAAPRRSQRAQNHDSGQLLFVQLRAAQVDGHQHEHQKQLGPR